MTAHKIILKHLQLEADGKVCYEMHRRLLAYWKWTELGGCKIRDQHAEAIQLRLNEVQMRAFSLMLEQASRGEPVRVRVMKARKTGVSTLVQTLFVFMCEHYQHQLAVTIAHEKLATYDIFEIARFAAENYELADVKPETGRQEIKFLGTNGRYYTRTAGGESVGAGSTPSLLHLSEKAKWAKKKHDTDYNATIAVPKVAETIIVDESTPKGRDLFYRQWEQSHDPESRYEPLFVPWYLDTSLRQEPKVGIKPCEDEVNLMRRASAEGIELGIEHLAWRRATILEIGDDVFAQEFPSTPEEAISTAKGLVLARARDCIIDRLPFDRSRCAWGELVGGIDFGSHDPTVIWTGWHVDGVVYLGMVWRETDSLAREQVGGCLEGVTYYCDPSAKNARQELSQAVRDAGLHGCEFLPAPRRVDKAEDPVIGELRQLRIAISDGRLKILREVAEQFVLECDNFRWNDENGRPDDYRCEETGHFDVIKALTYLVMGVMQRDTRYYESSNRNTGRIMTRREMFAS
jgi:hypothetical protein